jgi:uncharacterized membrane protein YGL010W
MRRVRPTGSHGVACGFPYVILEIEVPMALMSDRSFDDWLAEYELGHQHPVNRRCHTIGIPLIVLSFLAIVPALWIPPVWWFVGALFLTGWTFQFIGHAYEGKPPEFLKDWRFLFVGVRWWLWKLRSAKAARAG